MRAAIRLTALLLIVGLAAGCDSSTDDAPPNEATSSLRLLHHPEGGEEVVP